MSLLSEKQIQKAKGLNADYHEKLNWSWGNVAGSLDLRGNPSVESKEFAQAVARFQMKNDLKVVDGILGPNTYDKILEGGLDDCDKALKKVFDVTVEKESGGNYAAMNRNGEYRGKFDDHWEQNYGHPHPASGETHIGLSFGVFQFTQDSGSLGELLQKAAKKNKQKFKAIFGPTWQKLLDTLTAEGPSGMELEKSRGPRVQPVPVAGYPPTDIWKDPWVDRFRNFGYDPEFQKVQREYVVEEYLEPIIPFLKQHGLQSERMVAAAFSASIHRGVAGARSFMGKFIQSSNTESQVLSKMVRNDNRYRSFVQSGKLNWDEWRGFSVCDM